MEELTSMTTFIEYLFTSGPSTKTDGTSAEDFQGNSVLHSYYAFTLSHSLLE